MKKLLDKLNAEIAVKITDSVGSMWCAYLFALIAMVSLPSAMKAGTLALVTWFSQTFLQLVLLSVIMVGQDVASRKSERRAQKTYQDCEAILEILRASHGLLEKATVERRLNRGKKPNPETEAIVADLEKVLGRHLDIKA